MSPRRVVVAIVALAVAMSSGHVAQAGDRPDPRFGAYTEPGPKPVPDGEARAFVTALEPRVRYMTDETLRNGVILTPAAGLSSGGKSRKPGVPSNASNRRAQAIARSNAISPLPAQRAGADGSSGPANTVSLLAWVVTALVGLAGAAVFAWAPKGQS
jgi:hypothetical protein